MNGHAITMLGTGLIGDFYTNTLHGQRGRDRVRIVYSRSAERGAAFRDRWAIPESTTDLAAAIEHPDTDVVIVGLPNFLHEEAIELAAKAGKAVLCTKPLGRTAEEARRMLDAVEKAGVFAGYLEDLCYTPEVAQGGGVGPGRGDRRRHLGPLARDAPRPAFGLVLGRPADRRRAPSSTSAATASRSSAPSSARATGRSRSCATRTRSSIRSPTRTTRRAHPVRVGSDRPVRGQLDVPRRDGPARRGGRHPRHDLDEPLPADRLRDVHRRRRRRLRRGEGRDLGRLAVPGRRRGERARLRGHVQRHVRRDRRRAGRRGRRSTTATSSTRSWTPAYRSARAHAWDADRARLAGRRRRRGSRPRRSCTTARS